MSQPQQPPKVLAQTKTKAGIMLLVQYPGEKKKWVWKNKLPPESLSAWEQHLSR